MCWIDRWMDGQTDEWMNRQMNVWVEGWMIIGPINFFSWLESDTECTGPEVNKGQADFSALLSLLWLLLKPFSCNSALPFQS